MMVTDLFTFVKCCSAGCYHDLDGTKRWHDESGLCHREGGPAIECSNGSKLWYFRGRLHRESGPAVEYDNGDTSWYRHGKLHREDGPAITFSSGHMKWYYHGRQIKCSSQREFERLMRVRAFW